MVKTDTIMKLLGKELSEWGKEPDWEIERDRVWFTNIARNRHAYINRYKDGEYFSAIDDLIMDGNAFKPTWDIIRHIYAVVHLDFFTEAEWEPLIPIVELALRFNIDYVICLHDVDPYFKAMYDKYGYSAAYTLMKRMHLEFWQGLFAYDRKYLIDGENPRRPNYT